jgi:hypothetical protein
LDPRDEVAGSIMESFDAAGQLGLIPGSDQLLIRHYFLTHRKEDGLALISRERKKAIVAADVRQEFSLGNARFVGEPYEGPVDLFQPFTTRLQGQRCFLVAYAIIRHSKVDAETRTPHLIVVFNSNRRSSSDRQEMLAALNDLNRYVPKGWLLRAYPSGTFFAMKLKKMGTTIWDRKASPKKVAA